MRGQRLVHDITSPPCGWKTQTFLLLMAILMVGSLLYSCTTEESTTVTQTTDKTGFPGFRVVTVERTFDLIRAGSLIDEKIIRDEFIPVTDERAIRYLYFKTNADGQGDELWHTDGTAAGTMRVKDINPGAADANIDFLGFTSNLGVTTALLFFANDGMHGSELWRSDGTPAGTVLVKDINPGAAGSVLGFTGQGDGLTRNGVVYFIADDGTHGRELWKSDGTTTGTVMVKDINPGAPSSSILSLQPLLTLFNNLVYFAADDGVHGIELWQTDGTDAGTVLVKDINLDANPASTSSRPQNAVVVGATMYFLADDGLHGQELWKSDGTDVGTVLVKDINPGFGHALISSSTLTVNGTTLYFSATDGVHGQELWKSDGTAAGTVMVADILPGPSDSSPNGIVAVASGVFFSATDGTHGLELWKSDGTAVGTQLVKDIKPGAAHSSPSQLTELKGIVVFTADDGVHGDELWQSNGTEAGTVLVQDINPGVASSDINGLTNIMGVLQFAGVDPTKTIVLAKGTLP
jgi:ELWxxDGT repeat protein